MRTEPTVAVSVSLIEEAADIIEGDRGVFSTTQRLRALLSQPTPTAEPCTCPPPATHLGEGPDQDCPKHGDRTRAPCTPSAEHVRAVYATQHGAILAEEHGREFDRWLVEHDAEVSRLSELGRRYALRAADGFRSMREDAYLEVDRIRDVVRAAPHAEECEFGEPDPRSYIGTGVTVQPTLPCTCWKRDALAPVRRRPSTSG